MTAQPTQKESPQRQPMSRAWSLLKNLWRRVENIVFALTILLILLYFVLQMPAVQNWLVGHVTAYLSAELKTEVRVQHVDIEFFDNLVLDGLYVEDLKGDTLLYAEKLSAGLSTNFFSAFYNKLEFNEISLVRARVNIHREENERYNTLKALLKNLPQSSGGGGGKKSFSVRVQNLYLTDVELLNDDVVRGQRMFFRIPSATLRINNLDIPANIVDIRSVSLEGFAFEQEERKSKPLPQGLRPAAKATATKTNSRPPDTLRFLVGQFSLHNGRFKFDNAERPHTRADLPDVMDYDHLSVQNIDFQAENIEFNDELEFSGRLKHLSAREQCGFGLVHGESGRVVVNDTLTALYGAKIQTVSSTLGDTIVLRYREYEDYLDFEDKVEMDIRLARSAQLSLGDLSFFSEDLATNPFFVANKNELANLSGAVHGKVNKLRGDNLEIQLGTSTYIRGQFRGNELADRNKPMLLVLDFDELRTDMVTISRIVPRFSAPAYFYRLGKIGFKGSYQLFDGIDHILYGNISSDLGNGRVDMQLNLKDGKEKATYRGTLNMRNFDLAGWTGDQDFGKTTFNVTLAEGSKGLTLPTIHASIKGNVDTFSYRGYTYRDIKLSGLFEKLVFDGNLDSNDPNVDFSFDGNINLKDTIPAFEFNAKLRRLDLGVLNLVKEDWVLFGEVKRLRLRGKTLNDVVGSATLRNFRLLQDREDWHYIDSLTFDSYFNPDGTRYFGFNSDIAKLDLTGRFNLSRIPKNLVRLFGRYHPDLAQQIGFTLRDSAALTDDYSLFLQIRNTDSLTHLVSRDLDALRDVMLRGNVNARKGVYDLTVETPRVRFGGLELLDPSFRLSGEQDSVRFSLRLPTALSGGNVLPPVFLGGSLVGDEMHFRLEAKDDSSRYVESVYLAGVLSVVDSLWQIRFNSSKISLLNQDWLIEDDNFVRFSASEFYTKDFELFNGNQRILVESQNAGRGLRFSLTNFNLSELNRFLDPESISLRGNIFDFDVSVRDIFLVQGIEAGFLTDTVFVNQNPYGVLLANLSMEDLSAPLKGEIFLLDDKGQGPRQVMRIAGGWLPSGQEEKFLDNIEQSVRPNEFQAQIETRSFPFEAIETFVPEISKTTGLFDAKIQAGGPINSVSAIGNVHIQEGGFQIDYLKSSFYIKSQDIRLTKNEIIATGDTVYDISRQHMAFIKGGLEHDHFSKWRLNCSIESPDEDFLVLNTLPNDNDLYYGRGAGRFKAVFSGSFSRTNIQIDAITGKETRLFIPLSTTADSKEFNFIRFNNQNKEALIPYKKGKNFTFSDLKGLNFEMNLTVTDKAEIQMIFDEQAGDIIKGRGEGDIKLAINREGEFRMYGSYLISKGEYLFTLLNIVNKPFTVARGGTINWYGDPYSAQITLDATYEINTSAYNFVKDEVELLKSVQPQLLDESSKATRVIVTMHLKGDLMKPSISFDLDFPNISSRLRTVTDNRLRVLRQDQSELSRQVFGLVVIGTFLPPNAGFIQSSDYVASAFNTFTQMISNQFSNYLAGLASEWFGGAVSSVGVNIAYSDYQNELSDPNQPINQGGRELQVRLSSGFVNDRVTVQFGSQFGLGGSGVAVQDGFLGEDVTVEIQLTENRQWRMKVYQRTEPDISGQRRSRYGFGLSFRKDYDSFSDMWKGLNEKLTKKG